MLPRVTPFGVPGAMPYWDIASEGTNGIFTGLPQPSSWLFRCRNYSLKAHFLISQIAISNWLCGRKMRPDEVVTDCDHLLNHKAAAKCPRLYGF